MGKDLKGKELGKGIRQKKCGAYEARALIKGISINVCKSTLKECKQEFELQKAKVEKQRNIIMKDTSLDDWYEEWFDRYKKSRVKETSINVIKRRYYNTFGKRLGKRKIVDILNIDIQKVINELVEEKKSTKTIRSALGNVRECFESAKNNRIIEINPCFDICIPWENNTKLRRFLTKEEQQIFLDRVNFRNDWYLEMFHIMFNTGMRVGEVGGLKWEDVNFKDKCININHSLSCQYENGNKRLCLTTPKTHNSYRKIPFMGNVEEMLLRQKEKQNKAKKQLGDRWREDGISDLVFTTSLGSPVSRYIAERQIDKVVKEINDEEMFNAIRENRVPKLFDKMYPHAIRHTFCSRCFEYGLNPKVIQGIMGHQHYSTTIDIYTHTTEENVQDEVMKYNNV